MKRFALVSCLVAVSINFPAYADNTPTVAQQFAAAAIGHQVPSDSKEVKTADVLLRQAAKKYRVSEQKIFDIVSMGASESKQKGFDYYRYEMLEAISVIDYQDKSSLNRLSQLFAMYIVDRESGMNHSEALVGVRDLSRDVLKPSP